MLLSYTLHSLKRKERPKQLINEKVHSPVQYRCPPVFINFFPPVLITKTTCSSGNACGSLPISSLGLNWNACAFCTKHLFLNNQINTSIWEGNSVLCKTNCKVHLGINENYYIVKWQLFWAIFTAKLGSHFSWVANKLKTLYDPYFGHL